LHELNLNAQENEKLMQNTHQLALSLMRSQNRADVIKNLVACLSEDFSSECVRVISFDAIAGIEAEWYVHVPADDTRLQAFKDCLESNEPQCGRLNSDKSIVLFGEDKTFTQSIALIPINGVGLIAIGSADNHRFYPGMGTLFLRWIGELYQTALIQFRR
jgi:uncharacterized protein YigA (DUF484 family)